MLKISGRMGYGLVACIENQVVHGGVIPNEWCSSNIVNCYQGKGDVLSRNNYMCIKLLDQLMKVTERAIVLLIRE